MRFWKWYVTTQKQPENVPPTLISRVTKIEADILDLYVTVDTIRNKVLRKIQFKHTKEEEEKDNSKDLYGGILLPE